MNAYFKTFTYFLSFFWQRETSNYPKKEMTSEFDLQEKDHA